MKATDQGLPLELGRLFLQEPNPTLARRLYAAVSPRGSPKTRPPGAKDIEITEEESDAKARRVREILDEYLVKAPQATQWPPGRRIRVRGVDLFYKVRLMRTLINLRIRLLACSILPMAGI